MRVRLTTEFFNVRIPLHLDISTGDIITPSAVDYKYKTVFDEGMIDLLSYNYETIVAEKLQTVLKRNVLNSRMKDLYDLYFFMKYKKDDLDRGVFKNAVENTFSHRDSLNELNALTEILERIRTDETQQKFWENYRHRFSYAKDISLDEIINEISAIKNMIV
ncbi:MAG: nucleotidyl transferase AbiEii/AbiGii toxin family protein [Erysipelotrichaceae bacterium]|nr:nucleotidyl transferase AbiEii/AbiGii toxin family protein [Clostridia bacterium]MBQ6216933.1 nucleotidyl transferase AbiEii/AbiGii toxin family protein [Erysipelotrichaceae bacterium]